MYDFSNSLIIYFSLFAEKQNSRVVSDIQFEQKFIRGIPSHATLPRSYSKKQTKKKGWLLFGGKQKSKS